MYIVAFHNGEGKEAMRAIDWNSFETILQLLTDPGCIDSINVHGLRIITDDH